MNNALILLWNGNGISDYLIGVISEILFTNGICSREALTIKYKDADGIANSLVRDADVIAPKQNVHAVDAAVENAVVYIGTIFKSQLAKKNYNDFKDLISAKYIIEKAHSPYNYEKQLVKAVEILSTHNSVIPGTLAARYHFNQKVVDIVKEVYNEF